MPDITMCKGDDCPRKFMCWRFTAKPSEFRQAYFQTPPYYEPALPSTLRLHCDYFIDEKKMK